MGTNFLYKRNYLTTLVTHIIPAIVYTMYKQNATTFKYLATIYHVKFSNVFYSVRSAFFNNSLCDQSICYIASIDDLNTHNLIVHQHLPGQIRGLQFSICSLSPTHRSGIWQTLVLFTSLPLHDPVHLLHVDHVPQLPVMKSRYNSTVWKVERRNVSTL